MNPGDPGKSVLITGASTGIGAACALHLDEKGVRVFAGVRKESDGTSLKRSASSRLACPILAQCSMRMPSSVAAINSYRLR